MICDLRTDIEKAQAELKALNRTRRGMKSYARRMNQLRCGHMILIL